MTTDHNEAMKLAGELVAPIGTQTSYQTAHEAAALLRKQAAELKSARAETNRIIALLDAANDERKALRAEVERLRAREKACSTVNEGECIALVRMGQELAEAMGLNPLTASPADIVAAARKATQ